MAYITIQMARKMKISFASITLVQMFSTIKKANAHTQLEVILLMLYVRPNNLVMSGQ